MSPPLSLDLHVHSRHSPDGRSTIAQYARRAQEIGLGGFALTDHNSTAGHAELASLRSQFPGLLLVPGVEVSTAVGHLLVYGVSEAPPPGRPLAETLEWARDHGGEAVLAHPFRWPHGAGPHLASPGSLRAVETLNGHNGAGPNRRGAELAARLGLPGTGASDAHHVEELGRAFTTVGGGCGSPDDVLEAIRRGAIAASGRSLTPAGWVSWALRAGAARLARGFKGI